MKKLVLLLAVIAGFAFTANAQTEGAVRKLSIGAEFGLPTVKHADAFIAGGSLHFEQPISKSLNLTFSGGYASYVYTGARKDQLKALGKKTSYGFVPLKVGAKYYFGGNFYAAGEVGVAIGTENGAQNGGGTYFIAAPSLGASFAVSPKSSLDFSLRYENWSKNNNTIKFLGLRAAYAFGL